MNTNKFRQMVSLKKKRFQEDGYDLDLTYITPRIIAFGYPAVGREAIYRNPKEECIRFYESRHKDHYMIYNLCAEPERQYKAKIFQGRVAKFQFYDHNAPPLGMMPQMCQHAADWLAADEENVVGIHCKAGKGRTGVMICILLFFMGKFETIQEAMDFYGEQRTYNGKGVTIPSQKRYIRYFASTRESGFKIPNAPMVFVKKLKMKGISLFQDPTKLNILIECITNWSSPDIPLEMNIVYNSKNYRQFTREVDVENDEIVFDLGLAPVCGDVKVVLFTGNASKKERMCWFWFHTSFVEETFVLQKDEIDKAVGDKEHKVFAENFSIEMEWAPSEIPEETTCTSTAGDDGEEVKEKKKKLKKKKSSKALNKSQSDATVSRKKKKKSGSKSGLSKHKSTQVMPSAVEKEDDDDVVDAINATAAEAEVKADEQAAEDKAVEATDAVEETTQEAEEPAAAEEGADQQEGDKESDKEGEEEGGEEQAQQGEDGEGENEETQSGGEAVREVSAENSVSLSEEVKAAVATAAIPPPLT